MFGFATHRATGTMKKTPKWVSFLLSFSSFQPKKATITLPTSITANMIAKVTVRALRFSSGVGSLDTGICTELL